VEVFLAGVPGTRSVFAERTADGYFLDVTWDAKTLASLPFRGGRQNALSPR